MVPNTAGSHSSHCSVPSWAGGGGAQGGGITQRDCNFITIVTLAFFPWLSPTKAQKFSIWDLSLHSLHVVPLIPVETALIV